MASVTNLRNVQVRNLTQRFGRTQALAGVDLEIGTGVFGLLGPNGAGKTTLLRTLATVLSPGDGSVRLLGCDPEDATERRTLRRRLGYLPQALGYYPNFTVSGGMLRRVGIAQAIVNAPDLLLLDEPTAGLDPEQRVAFRTLLRQIGARGTVIVSTHLVEDVAAACSEVGLMSAGRIVFRGTPTELTARGTGFTLGDSDLERGYGAVLAGARA